MIANNTKNEPILAATGKDQLENEVKKNVLPNKEAPNINKATPKLAPEEIPKTKGPANGFLKSVCINNPEIAKPEPTKTAVIAFGNLKLFTMVSQLCLEALPKKILSKISFKGIETDPKLKFNTTQKHSKSIKIIKCML